MIAIDGHKWGTLDEYGCGLRCEWTCDLVVLVSHVVVARFLRFWPDGFPY